MKQTTRGIDGKRGIRRGATIPDFASFKRLSDAVALYAGQFEGRYSQAVPAAADALRKETGALRRPANDAARKVPIGAGRAVKLSKLAGQCATKGDYLGAALVYATGIIEGCAGAEALRGKLDDAVDAASKTEGAVGAEKICRAVTFSGLPVFPKGLKRYVRAAFAQLKREGRGEEAFKVALYWSTSCLSALGNGGSIAGFTPPITTDEAKEAFAGWKGL